MQWTAYVTCYSCLRRYDMGLFKRKRGVVIQWENNVGTCPNCGRVLARKNNETIGYEKQDVPIFYSVQKTKKGTVYYAFIWKPAQTRLYTVKLSNRGKNIEPTKTVLDAINGGVAVKLKHSKLRQLIDWHNEELE